MENQNAGRRSRSLTRVISIILALATMIAITSTCASAASTNASTTVGDRGLASVNVSEATKVVVKFVANQEKISTYVPKILKVTNQTTTVTKKSASTTSTVYYDSYPLNTSGCPGDLAGEIMDRAQKCMAILIREGYTVESAAAVCGNIFQESRISPTAGSGSYYGLCQWNKNNRWNTIVNYCNKKGYSSSSLEGQLMAMTYSGDRQDGLKSISAAKSAKSVASATTSFLSGYEGAAGQQTSARKGAAAKIYNTYRAAH